MIAICKTEIFNVGAGPLSTDYCGDAEMVVRIYSVISSETCYNLEKGPYYFNGKY